MLEFYILWKYLIYFCTTVANWTDKSPTIIFEYFVWNYMKGVNEYILFCFYVWANYSFKMYVYKTENVKEMLDCIEVYSAHFQVQKRDLQEEASLEVHGARDLIDLWGGYKNCSGML